MSSFVRAALIAMLLLGISALSRAAPDGQAAMYADGSLVPQVLAAPAHMSTDGLVFSTDVDAQANAIDPSIEFSSSTERVWTSFNYREYAGESMTYLVRANGEDWRWGDLDCCEAQNGRFAFPIERRSGDLGGAAYDTFVYANDAEVGHGGFGVRGTGGFDDDDNNNGNDNDNDDDDDDDDDDDNDND